MSACAQVPLPMNISLAVDKDQPVMIYKEVMNVKCLCLFSENFIPFTSHVLILNF